MLIQQKDYARFEDGRHVEVGDRQCKASSANRAGIRIVGRFWCRFVIGICRRRMMAAMTRMLSRNRTSTATGWQVFAMFAA